MRNKRNAAIAGIVSLVVMTICLWLIVRNIGDPAMPLNTLAPAGKQNWEIFNLVKPVFLIAGLVFLAVEAGIIWMAVRFKRNKGDVDGVDEPTQTHGNTTLEIGWTIVPALVLAILAFLWAVRRGQFDDLDTPSLDILGDDERPAPPPEKRDAP